MAFATIACFALVPLLAAGEPARLSGDASECGETLPASGELATELAGAAQIEGYSGGGLLPPFFVAEFPQPSLGTVLLVRKGNGWKAVIVQEGGSIEGVYFDSYDGGALVFSLWSREGPGDGYVTLATADGFQSWYCSEVPFPAELNEPTFRNEFLSLTDFNMDEKGRGALVGSAEVETDGVVETRWYRANTPDFGRTWSEPERLAAAPAGLKGRYRRGEQELDHLLAGVLQALGE